MYIIRHDNIIPDIRIIIKKQDFYKIKVFFIDQMKGMICMKKLKKRIREARWNSIGDILAMVGLSIAGVFGIFIDGAIMAHEEKMSLFSGSHKSSYNDSMAEDLFNEVGNKIDDFKENREEIKDLKEQLLEKQVKEAKEKITNSNYNNELAAYLRTLITKCSYLNNKEQKRFLLSIKRVLAKYAKEYNTYANSINGQATVIQKIMERLAIIEQAIDKRLTKNGNIILIDKKRINKGDEVVIVPTKKMSV